MSDEEIDSEEEAPYEEDSDEDGLVEMSDDDSEEAADEEGEGDNDEDDSEGSDDGDNDASEEIAPGAVSGYNQGELSNQNTKRVCVHTHSSFVRCHLVSYFARKFTYPETAGAIPHPKCCKILHH